MKLTWRLIRKSMERNVETPVCEACGQRSATIGSPIRGQLACSRCFAPIPHPLLSRSQSCDGVPVWAGLAVFQQRKKTLQGIFDQLKQYCDLLSSTFTQVANQRGLYQQYVSELRKVLLFSVQDALNSSSEKELKGTACRFLLGNEDGDQLDFQFGITPEALNASIQSLCRTSWEMQPPKECFWCPDRMSRSVPEHSIARQDVGEMCSATCLGIFASKRRVFCMGCPQPVSVQASPPIYLCPHFFFHNKDCVLDSFQRYSRTFRKPVILPCAQCNRSFGPENLRGCLSEQEYSEHVKQVRDTVCCACDSQQLCWVVRCGHWLCANHESAQELKCNFCNEAVVHYSSPKARQLALSCMNWFDYAQGSIDTCPVTFSKQVHPSLQAAKDNVRFIAEKCVQLDHPNICKTFACFLDLGSQEQATSVLLSESCQEHFSAALMVKKYKEGTWPEEELLHWLGSFADALSYAKEHYLSHGHIKLKNMMFRSSGQPALCFKAQYSVEAQDKDIRNLRATFGQLYELQVELGARENETKSECAPLKTCLRSMFQKDSQCWLSLAELKLSCQLPRKSVLKKECMFCQTALDEMWELALPADLKSLSNKSVLCSLKCARHLSMVERGESSVKCTGCEETVNGDELSSPSTVSLNCGHPFHHLNCLEKSLQEYLGCPQCLFLPDSKEVNALLGKGGFERLQAEMCSLCHRGRVHRTFGLCKHALCVKCDSRSFFSFTGSNCKQCRDSS